MLDKCNFKKPMSIRTKFILTYLGGIITGALVVFSLGFFIAISNNPNRVAENNDVQLFDNPKQEVIAKTFKVMQVLPDGSALATYESLSYEGGSLEYGTVVMFLANDDESFYDDQVISLPKGKCFRQIGTYRYNTRQNIEKTVPVLGIFDK